MKHDDPYRRALKGLKREAPDAQKQALVRHLRERSGHLPTLLERLGLIIERRWPEWRMSAYGLSFASALAVIVATTLTLTSGAVIDAPEIDDIDFDGAAAMVIESPQNATTLIWLSDAEEVAEEDDEEDDEVDEEEEEVEDL